MKELTHKRILKVIVTLALALLIALANAAPVMAQGGARDIAGSYIALLDLEGLREPPIETLYVVLDLSGSALFVSEHEDDKESTGVGVWRHLRGGKIGMGVASFRYANPACELVGAPSPPNNCVLKVGGTLERVHGGGLEGELAATLESVDATVVVPLGSFPVVMEKLELGDFPSTP